MKEQYTLILNHAGMEIGGIEVCFSKLMKYCLMQKYRVIWITNEDCYKRASFRNIIDDDRIEKILVSPLQKLIGGAGQSKIQFTENENVIMLSCDILNFADAEGLREKNNVKTFYHFMLLPHYTGSAYYPERLFESKYLKKKCFANMEIIAKQLVFNDCVRAFSEIQLTAYENNYKVKIDEKNEKTLKSVEQTPVLDLEKLTERAKRRKNKITITTCARFDFPHKAYILGLIEAFEMVSKKYSHIELIIVGYGDGQKEIENKINELPSEIANKIKMVGKKDPDDLIDIYNNSTINVGLAGALLDGAACGLPSLVVQHYSPECNCFGFLEDVRTDIAIGIGNSIAPYLEKLVTCSNDEYIKHGLEAYKTQVELNRSQPEYIFEQKNKTSRSVLTKKQRRYCKLIHCVATIKYRCFKESGFSEEK